MSLARVTAPRSAFELLTLREAVARFGIDFRELYRWAAEGRLHPVRPVGRTLYPEWELRELVERSPSPAYRFRAA